MLKSISDSDENRDKFVRLPLSPNAILGSIVHKGLQRLSGRKKSTIEHWFDFELDSVTVPSVPHTSLREALRSDRIETARALLISVSGKSSQRSTNSSRRRPSPRMFGAELELLSQNLRLKGRADLVQRNDDGTIDIIDFKTGSVTDEYGQIRNSYVLQLQAYALMFREQTGLSATRLLLDNGTRSIVQNDNQSLQSAEERIADLTLRFAKQSVHTTPSLATPGNECASCRIRPTCEKYLADAPTWWRALPREVKHEPLDTWGEIVRLSEMPSGVAVHLIDAAHRAVKIEGLALATGKNTLRAGSKAWFFNLRATRKRIGFNGERPHPRLFFEFPPNRDDGQRAWDLQYFS